MRFRLPWKKRALPTKRTIWEEILKRVFLFKNEVHIGKRHADVDGLAELVRFFFEKLLKMDENTTLEEVVPELERQHYHRSLLSKVESLIKKISQLKYAQAEVTKEDLYSLLFDFEHVVYLLNMEQRESVPMAHKAPEAKPRTIPRPVPEAPSPEVNYKSVHISVEEPSFRVETLPIRTETPKISLVALEFNNFYAAGKKAVQDKRFADARAAYQSLARSFAQLSKSEKKALHPQLLDLYDSIMAT
ncbi:MAG: hypothetical protein V1735_03930 [Nanoarchaeota archaeon]